MQCTCKKMTQRSKFIQFPLILLYDESLVELSQDDDISEISYKTSIPTDIFTMP